MTVIVWIRRSLRKHDNTALVEASKKYDEIIPLYIIDENYFGSKKLGYPRVRFWKESLEKMKRSLKDEGKDLIIRKGKPVEELSKIIEETDTDKVNFNRNYSPYARKRDQKVGKLDVKLKEYKDLVMFDREEITTSQNTPYQVYSYYRDKWFKKEEQKTQSLRNFSVPEIESDEIPSLKQLGFEKPESMDWIWKPGRKGGKKRLEQFRQKIGGYSEKRDYPAKNATSKLSPHLKFGTVSIREVFETAEEEKNNSKKDGVLEWQEQLAWRDFYFQLLWNHPETVKKAFREEYRSIEWREKKEAKCDWQRFIDGKTGFPFVDAGMRQLKKEGWMHNRPRMVVTSFAAKDLRLDWKLLHNYFKKMFVDAELSAMIGGIQWAYSIGTDAQPYFRVFNPWTQGEKYDPKGDYIREYIPELKEVSDEYIHRPQKMPEKVQKKTGCIIEKDYPKAIVDHDTQRKKAVETFEKARNERG